ncbi:MAG: class I SAM-dependent methyltransferase [Magnetococcales bacterium]|nr:class I SAM-dependent methyltransferase [Magnetococcales bacterium]
MLKTLFKLILKFLPESMRQRVLEEAGASLSSKALGESMQRLALRHSESIPADQALGFLFRLDNHLYSLQGRHSIRYNDGVHTKHLHTGYHDFFINRVKAGERVLDVGCGTGMLAFDLADKAGGLVLGIDLEEKNITIAKKRFCHANVEFVVGDIMQYSDNRPFDIVILSNVLEHLTNRAGFLRQLAQITKSYRFLIRVPLFERDWRIPLKKELAVEWRLDPTHETEYSQESFAQEIDEAGLKITHQEIRWGEIWAYVVLPKATTDTV